MKFTSIIVLSLVASCLAAPQYGYEPSAGGSQYQQPAQQPEQQQQYAAPQQQQYEAPQQQQQYEQPQQQQYEQPQQQSYEAPAQQQVSFSRSLLVTISITTNFQPAAIRAAPTTVLRSPTTAAAV